MPTSLQTRSGNICRAAAVAGGAYAVVTGISALIGWAFDLPGLTDWTGQGISMFANAALCGVCAGTALIAIVTTTRRAGITAVRVLGGIAALIAGLTLVEHVSGIDLGIDTLLVVRAWGQSAATAPMRMGPPASTSYMLLGAALVLVTLGPRARLAATTLVLVTVAVASLSLAGYCFGANQLFGVARYSGIALNTSTVIAGLSIGIMAAVPEHGLVYALLRRDAGGALLRRLLVPIVIAPLLLGWIRLRGEHAGYYDPAFGSALRSLAEAMLLFGLLWWTARSISWHASSTQDARTRLAEIVESSEQRLRAIVEATPECVKIVGPDGSLEFVNAAGLRMIEAESTAEVQGRPVVDFVAPEHRAEWIERHRRVCAGERLHWQFEMIGLRGTRRWVESHAVPLELPDGRTAQLTVAHDIAERVRWEREREELLENERAARGEAERASRLKDDFLATLSHELRTPLNAIFGWSQLLTVGSEPAELAEGLDAIQRNARAQAQLIEDLLDMSRIISGKVRLDVQPTNLLSVIMAAVESVTPAADAKGITVRKIVDSQAGVVSGDPVRMQQIVWNLLANAIKFTPQGGSVEVLLAPVESSVELTVRDTGIGMRPDDLSVIFDRFRQVDSSTSRRHGGLGLGLSIAKQLVELHGGTIAATSAGPGLGSTFVVRLPSAPMRADENDGSDPLRTTPPADRFRIDLLGVRVLVVDDEPDARALIRRVLTQCGADVRAAESARHGLEELRSFRPHVLVSDIGMPVTDGYQFIREVRSLSDDLGRTPAIALTAFARSEDRMRAMLAGYQVHVAKPIEPQELAVTVHSLSRQ